VDDRYYFLFVPGLCARFAGAGAGFGFSTAAGVGLLAGVLVVVVVPALVVTVALAVTVGAAATVAVAVIGEAGSPSALTTFSLARFAFVGRAGIVSVCGRSVPSFPTLTKSTKISSTVPSPIPT